MNDFLTIGGLLGLGVGALSLIIAFISSLSLFVLSMLNHRFAKNLLFLQIIKWTWLVGAVGVLIGAGLCGLTWHFYPPRFT